MRSFGEGQLRQLPAGLVRGRDLVEVWCQAKHAQGADEGCDARGGIAALKAKLSLSVYAYAVGHLAKGNATTQSCRTDPCTQGFSLLCFTREDGGDVARHGVYSTQQSQYWG